MAQNENVAQEGPKRPNLNNMTPREIVAELDKYIVGQSKAKRALAIAMRDRFRRQQLAPEVASEVHPRNIILIGSTGVGKTELARRIAKLTDSPFLKVEASKFTEVGYVGRDVESIIRDLTEISVELLRQERIAQIEKKAEKAAEDRLLEILVPKRASARSKKIEGGEKVTVKAPVKKAEKTKAQVRKELREGKLNSTIVELEVQERFYSTIDLLPSGPEEEIDMPFKDFLAGLLGTRTFTRKMRVDEAIEYLITEEESRLVDMDQITREALDRVESSAIVFVDELDKIAGREGGHGPDVSREGVQRDILPIVEGTSVSTRYGMVHTDHILFIAAGAFHVTKPSDLIPELQGRFPVRVEMDSLTKDDFITILKEPKNALTKQHQALLETEGIKIDFSEDAIRRIAHYAWLVNNTAENIGARRLQTIMEALLEQISFLGPENPEKTIVIDAAYVDSQVAPIVHDSDLSKFIL